LKPISERHRVLEIKNIDVFYGDVQVIWGVSLEVKQGEVVALIGANGAGKSTALKTVSGLLRPRKGEIFFNGTSLHAVEPYKRIDLGMALCPEARRLFVEMTVDENLDMGSLRGEARQKRAQTKEMVFGLFPRSKSEENSSRGRSPGASSRWSLSGGASWRFRSCSCSTNRPWAWPPFSCGKSSTS
jgi:branched-chain amino acid transport system ATP-binding protein